MQIAGAVQLHADPAGIGIERQPGVGDRHENVRHAEGGGGIGIAEFVQFAQTQHAVLQGAAHSDATGADRRNLRRQAGKGDIDLHPARRQIRPGGIAEHDIFDPLGAEPDIDQIVIRLNPAPVEFAADEIFCNGRALRPEPDQHQRERPGADAQPTQPCPANRFFAVLFFHAYGQPRLNSTQTSVTDA